jgi:hypothetical protein
LHPEGWREYSSSTLTIFALSLNSCKINKPLQLPKIEMGNFEYGGLVGVNGNK